MKPCSQRSLPSRGDLPTKRRLNLLLASSLLAATSSVALAQDGRLRVWGRNTEQQCNVPSSLGRVTAYAGGIYHSVALKADGTVACWGVVAEGQATVPPGLSGVVGIAAGHYHTAAVRGNGSVVCWGRNVEGQSTPPAINDAIAVSAGWKHTIALRANGTVIGWGSNLAGAVAVPAGLSGVSRIASGSQHNIVAKSDGTVVCWGAGTVNTGFNPNFGQSIVPAGLSGVVSVAGGLNHSVALKSDGSVRCWGQNSLGQCNVPATLSGVVSVAAGNAHTVALKSDGSIVGWGSGSSGQLTPPADIGFVAGVGSGGQFVGGFAAPAPTVQVVSTTAAFCNGANGAVDLFCTNANSVSWTGPNGFVATTEDLTGVSGGSYRATVVGSGGVVSVDVVVPSTPDTIAPVIESYIGEASAAADSLCLARMPDLRGSIVASDDCTAAGGLVLQQSPAPETPLGLGMHPVTLTVIDGSGNATVRSATFTVEGNSVAYFADSEGDGFGAGVAVNRCIAPAGHSTVAGDCNDSNPAVRPGAVEVCNGVDDNCAGGVDEGLPTYTYFADNDADSFGGAATPLVTCQSSPPAGFVVDATDCDDSSPDVRPGAPETCGNLAVDNDCDGSTAEAEANDRSTFWADADGDGAGDPASPTLACSVPAGFAENSNDQCPTEGALTAPRTYFRDNDGDGFGDLASPSTVCAPSSPAGFVETSNDCNDAQLQYADVDGDGRGAGAPVACGVPSNDDQCPNTQSRTAPVTWYADTDADGFGAAATAVSACDQPSSSHILVAGDCDDSSAAARPGAAEVCADSGIDNNCDGNSADVDAGAPDKVDFYADVDADGHSVAVTSRFCPGTMNAGYLPTLSSPVDCNDASASIHPAAIEACDPSNTDENCNGTADDLDAGTSDATRTDFYADADGDGHSVAAATRFCDPRPGYLASRSNPVDCNDASATVYPGAMELCNGIDDDCNLVVDNDLTYRLYYRDADGDGYGSAAQTELTCTGAPSPGYAIPSSDCNDADAGINPAAAEVCDPSSTDENCNGLADDLDPGVSDATRTSFYADADGDGYTVNASTRLCDFPANGFDIAPEGDCDDANPSIHPGAREICDAANADEDCDTLADNADSSALDSTRSDFFADSDADGYTVDAATRFCDLPASGFDVAPEGDCNDANAAIHPGAQEICDEANTDEDCDGSADNADGSAENAGKSDFYIDSDGDGFGAGAAIRFCDLPAGHSVHSTDCDDAVSAINPNAVEACDAGDTDEDCDGLADDADSAAAGKSTFYRDADGDGYTGATTGLFCDMPAGYEVADDGDCDDESALVFPGGAETCANLAVDNDCDGSVAESEASDALTFYADADGDGAGDPAASVLACSAPTGHVAVAGDACPNTAARTAPITWYGDADNDGVGDSSVTISACDQPAGHVIAAGDTCPADGGKTEPGVCGCGSPDLDINENGVIDCVDFYLTLTPSATSVKAGDQLTVVLSSNYPSAVTQPVLRVIGAQFSLLFDQTRLRLDGVSSDIANGPFPLELVERIDNDLGTLRYAAGIDYTGNPAGGMTAASDVAVLTFTVLPIASECDVEGLMAIVPIVEETNTCLTTVTPAGLVVREPLVNPFAAIDLDSTAPVFSGIPANALVATDARSIFGGTVAAPTVEAEDGCDGALGFTFGIVFPGGASATAWPSNNLFPIGVSTMTWHTSDAAGNETTIVRTVEVANHQLLDARIQLDAPQAGASPRAIRIIAGASSQVVEAVFPAWQGATPTVAVIRDIPVPVAADYGCISVKDTAATVEGQARFSHSLTDTATPTVVDRRYLAQFSLLQGDSNDDDRVDIYDFSIFAAERSVPGNADRAPGGIANFNGDNRVNNADFAALSSNFFRIGQGCTGALGGNPPVQRVSVKELRRRGLGNLAVADINRDGWVDMRDIQAFVAGSGTTPPVELAPPDGLIP